MIGKESKERILKRLQQENARSPYLNSLPGRLNSYSKIDLAYLQEFNSSLLNKIAPSIMEGSSFTYSHNPEKNTASVPHDNSIQKGIKNIVDRAKTHLTETGSETLSIGYPILITRSSNSTSDCKAIPLFTWPLSIKTEKLANRWKFTFNKTTPHVNQSLIGLIESDQIPLTTDKLYSEFINETIESLNQEMVTSLLDEFIKANKSLIKRIPESWDKLEKMPFETKTAMKDNSAPGISIELWNCAVLTNYKESKYSIIKDYHNFGDSIPNLKQASSNIGKVSGNTLDPSQSGAIDDINTRNHVVLHGPPGTGKSQTITGIITAALANELKIAVVCQKAAAINVLIENLSGLGISEEVIRITNISSDRKTVIEKARGFERTTMPKPLKSMANSLSRNYNKLGTEIVTAHLRTREQKLTEYFNWNESVGRLSNLKRLHPELAELDYLKKGEQWSKSSESNHILAEELDELHMELFNFGENMKYLNPNFLNADPYEDIRKYFDQVETLIANNDSHIQKLRSHIYTQQEAIFKTLKNDLLEAQENIRSAQELKDLCKGKAKNHQWLNDKLNLNSTSQEIILENSNELKNTIESLQLHIDQITVFIGSVAYSKYKSGPNTIHLENLRAKILLQQENALNKLNTDLQETEENFNNARLLISNAELLEGEFGRNQNALSWIGNELRFSSIEFSSIDKNISIIDDAIRLLELDVSGIKGFTNTRSYQKFKNISGLQKLFYVFSKEYRAFKAENERQLEISYKYHISTLDTHLHEHLLNELKEISRVLQKLNQLSKNQQLIFEKHKSDQNRAPSSFEDVITLLRDHQRDLHEDLNQKKAFKYDHTLRFEGVREYLIDYDSNQKEYELFQKDKINLLSKSECFGILNLNIQEHKDLNSQLNDILEAQNKISQLASAQSELFQKHHSDLISQIPLFDRTVELIEKHLADIKHDLTKEDDFKYEKTSEFDKIEKYQHDRTKNLSSKKDLRQPGRLLNRTFGETAITKPSDGLNILSRIQEKALHLEGVISLFEKSSVFESELNLTNRKGISFSDELTYGILTYVTQNHYSQHQQELPRKSHNNKIIRQGEALQLIQEHTIKKALYNSRVRRVEAIKAIEDVSASFAKVFSFRGRSKKTLRQITQSYKHEFTELFPIIMMTPQVCCNLFEASHSHFDLVIVDEASQVELHDILPVLYKGKSLVIAGDQHQMPPSNFFSKQVDLNEENEDEDDMEPLIDVESLLEFCQSSTKLFKSRFLDFHYRSNHAGLINFSNDAIYKRLVIKPTREWGYAPFMLSKVHSGNWINQRNEREALRVINLIKDLEISQGDIPRILVATLNAPHRKEIQDQIAEEIAENPDFEERMNSLYSGGFDIKNLENLQGDECDLLIISTGYGPGLDGRFRQNLGVINREKGYRLLNVLITRAKFKVILVTSIPKAAYQEYVNVLKSGKTGRGLLYAYISYVEAHTLNNRVALKKIGKLLRDYGIQNTMVGDTRSLDKFESPFEEEVYEFLIRHFDPEKITLQEEHINSGFRIDMVLKPNGNEGPRIAIECDGASFHSGWQNQTLDLHRQNLLEAAGYRFVRIWSTDWWRAQDVCEAAILAEIQDHIKNFKNEKSKEFGWLTLKDEEIELEELDTISEIDLLEDEDEDEPLGPIVSKDCIVTLKTDNKSIPKITLAIVPNQGRISKNSKEITYLVFNAELPSALMGYKVEETVKFRNTTYTIESIE